MCIMLMQDGFLPWLHLFGECKVLGTLTYSVCLAPTNALFRRVGDGRWLVCATMSTDLDFEILYIYIYIAALFVVVLTFSIRALWLLAGASNSN